MTPLWPSGALARFPDPGDAPLAWECRLDDPAVAALAAQAPLLPADLADLAGRPRAAARGVRRRLARLLLARVGAIHPAAVVLRRDPGGAPRVDAPAGWHLSVAGQWPWCLLGVGRHPLGVDVEPADAPPPPADALTPAERAALAGAPPAALLARWVAKEAHAKLFGVAAQAEAAAIETLAEDDGIVARSSAGRSVCYLRRGAATVAAVAVLPAAGRA